MAWVPLLVSSRTLVALVPGLIAKLRVTGEVVKLMTWPAANTLLVVTAAAMTINRKLATIAVKNLQLYLIVVYYIA